jgi:hypothetical protein
LSDRRNRREYDYQFDTLAFSGIAINKPSVVLMSYRDPLPNIFHRNLILGLGVLRRLHIYIAYREHVMYITSATAH